MYTKKMQISFCLEMIDTLPQKVAFFWEGNTRAGPPDLEIPINNI
jgi:hypothetical protein